MSCYELIHVRVGSEVLQARPIAWDREVWDGEGNDRDGVPVEAVEFVTTCPFCANLIQFKKDEIYYSSNPGASDKGPGTSRWAVGGAPTDVGCVTCGAGNAKLEVEELEPELETVVVRTSFKDPIASGLFGDEVDFERLKVIDLAKSGEAV
jgi:hypothetical protein